MKVQSWIFHDEQKGLKLTFKNWKSYHACEQRTIKIWFASMASTLMVNCFGLSTSNYSWPVNSSPQLWIDGMISSWNVGESWWCLKLIHQKLLLTMDWFYDFELKYWEKVVDFDRDWFIVDLYSELILWFWVEMLRRCDKNDLLWNSDTFL